MERNGIVNSVSRFKIEKLEDRIAPCCCYCCPEEEVKVKGNNGVGNGLDPQPPGDPPVNNGPGNPGNRHR